MNKFMVRTLVTLCMAAVLSPIALMAQSSICAKIPFDFTVAGKSLAAGDYTVRQLHEGILLIQNFKGKSGVMTLTMPAHSINKNGTAVLTFNRYGDSYFLSKVDGDTRGWELPRSAGEKELIAKLARSKPVVVTADLH